MQTKSFPATEQASSSRVDRGPNYVKDTETGRKYVQKLFLEAIKSEKGRPGPDVSLWVNICDVHMKN